MLRAITLDFWDTLYTSAVLPERVTLRQTALRRLLDAVGATASDEDIRAVYKASGAEAERWWREEHRGDIHDYWQDNQGVFDDWFDGNWWNNGLIDMPYVPNFGFWSWAAWGGLSNWGDYG